MLNEKNIKERLIINKEGGGGRSYKQKQYPIFIC